MVKMFTYYDVNYIPLADVVLPHFRALCNKWGYELVAPVSRRGNPYWDKIAVLSKLLPSTDYLIYCDIDMMILNSDFDFLSPLKESEHDAYVASDNYGICCAFIVLKNTKWTRQLLRTLLFVSNIESDIKFTEANNHQEDISDQHTFKALHRLFPSIRKKLLVMGDDFMTNKWLVEPNRKYKLYHFVSHCFSISSVIQQFKNL